jgi:hypothetical protein
MGMPVTQVPQTGVLLSGGKNEIAGYPLRDLVGTWSGPKGPDLKRAQDPGIAISKCSEENPTCFMRGTSGTQRNQTLGYVLNQENPPAHASGNTYDPVLSNEVSGTAR